MPATTSLTTLGSRRSPWMNSSAGGLAYSCSFRSTARTQKPSAFSRFTRWPPMKPPAPQTRTFFDIVLLLKRPAAESGVNRITYGNPRQANTAEVLLSYDLHDERGRCRTYL